MGFLAWLSVPQNKSRLTGALLAAAGVVTLPSPAAAMPNFEFYFLLALWFFFLGLAWLQWTQSEILWPLWFLGTLLSGVAWLRLRYLLPLIMTLCWGLWRRLENGRPAAAETKNKGSGVLSLVLLALFFPGIKASAGSLLSKAPANGEIPKYLRGYNLNDVVSCQNINQIPWKFKSDGKQTRLILKDTMVRNSETIYSVWEVFQVMDTQGTVSYIFRRPISGGGVEDVVVKDVAFNRIIESPNNRSPGSTNRKIVEVANFSKMIDRPVMIFTAKDGSTLTYAPGIAGRSSVTIQLAQTTGRLLPPVYLRGNYCDRPDAVDEDGSNLLIDDKKKAATPAAGATPTATPAK